VIQPRFRVRPAQGRVEPDKLLLRVEADRDWLVLAGPARRIWELLEYPATAAQVVQSLAAEYDAGVEAIAPAVDETIGLLVRHGLAEAADDRPENRARDLYLGLLKRAVANLIYPELELALAFMEEGGDGLSGVALQRALRDIVPHRPDDFQALVAAKQQGTSLAHAHTMIGMLRLANLERLAERIFAEGIKGDFLEAGVCRGGAAIFMRALQVAHEEADRTLWAVDSFAGVPPSIREEDARYGLHLEEARQPWIACDLLTVRDNFRRYGLLGPEVRFLAGWLAETLPDAPIGPLALLRLDVDLHSATADALDLLYDRVSPGGFIVVDDYGYLRCCRDAVNEFRERRDIAAPIVWIDQSGIYWQKPR
jgi:hypothetical protein